MCTFNWDKGKLSVNMGKTLVGYDKDMGKIWVTCG